MMKKQYQEPEMVTLFLDVIDVITSSTMTDNGTGNWDNEDQQESSDFFQ